MNTQVFTLALVATAFSPSVSFASSRADLPTSSSELQQSAAGDLQVSGTVGFDSSSFLYSTPSRGTQATTVNGTIRGKKESGLFHHEGEIGLYSFLTNRPQIGLEAPELYSSTRKGVLGPFTLTAGRKLESWSRLDGTWRMMSLWSPRWTWDELRPMVIGMTGVYLNYDSPRLRIVLFASPIAIPERGTPVTEENSNITSPNPFWKPLPSSLNVLGAQTAIRYSLAMPPLTEILFRPNFALRAKYQSESGFFISGNSGVLPVHSVQMAAEPFVSTSGSSGNLQVRIRPQFPMRNINTLETGYESPNGDFDIWASGSYEHPFRFENQDTWLNPIITPSTILSTGMSRRLHRDFRIQGSILSIREQAFASSSKLPNVSVDLPSRFPLKQGIQLAGNWRVSDRSESTMTWIHDFLNRNHFASLDFQHTMPGPRLTLGVGMDLILAQNTQGWVGRYAGDDRVRGWLKYAF